MAVKKITVLNRANVKLISDEAEAALAAIATKYGLTVKRNNGRFSPGCLSTKFDFNVVDASTGAPADFPRLALRVGLPADSYHKTFVYGGNEYTIEAIVTRRRKYPVSAVNAAGQSYKFGVNTVLTAWQLATALAAK
jgi:hypothetical protein